MHLSPVKPRVECEGLEEVLNTYPIHRMVDIGTYATGVMFIRTTAEYFAQHHHDSTAKEIVIV